METNTHPWKDALEGTVLKMSRRIEELEAQLQTISEERDALRTALGNANMRNTYNGPSNLRDNGN